MNKHLIIFKINDESSIAVISSWETETLHCCHHVPLVLLINNQCFVLSVDSIHATMYSLNQKLSRALSGKLSLGNLIKPDIGYIDNERSLFMPGKQLPDIDKYWLWSPSNNLDPKLNTWIYNDHQQNIILQVTPSYPWHYKEPKPEENYITYEVWMKSYKPLYTTIISQDTALEWLNKAQALLKTIKENMAATI